MAQVVLDPKKPVKTAAETFKLDKDDKMLLIVVAIAIVGGLIYMFIK